MYGAQTTREAWDLVGADEYHGSCVRGGLHQAGL
jgi:hypothetical protein